MPKFTVETLSSLNPEKAFEKIKTFLEKDPDLKKMDPKLTCDFNAQKLTGEAKGSQFKANIEVKKLNDSECKVLVHVDLPLLLTPFKNKIQETLQKKLSKALA